VLEALGQICPAATPDPQPWRSATRLADRHALTLYDATYAAIARARNTVLATLEHALLEAGLGQRPSELTARP